MLSLTCLAVFSVSSSFAIISLGKRVGCFTIIVFLMSCSCKCSVSLPCGAVGRPTVCDCVISWSYSLLNILQ